MSSLEQMVLLVMAAPLVGSLACLLLKNSRPKLISSVAALASFLTLLAATNTAWLSTRPDLAILRWDWFYFAQHTMSISFDFNRLTIPLMLIVASISFLVHIYSIGFFKGDPSLSQYFSTLGLFTFSMLGLTLSENLFQVFIFWELVGLCSYLLIGYYRHKPKASQAATKSFIINKIGDAGFLIALMLLWSASGELGISTLDSVVLLPDIKTWISAAVLLAVLTKSAQFPFHTWLPAAMEGPTPVSALIHSATMVAAGVFLMARLHFLFTPITLQVAAILGAITAIMGGLNALKETDLKKILAWSTLSQLGLMIMVAGNSGFNASFFHLLSHAIFKSGLFLMAGIFIIHQSSFEGTNNLSSRTWAPPVILLGLALIGFPITASFISKESMLASLHTPFYVGLFFLVNTITVFYTVRLIGMVVPFSKKKELGSLVKINPFMLIPFLLVSLASLWIFYSLSILSSNMASTKWDLLEASPLMTWSSVLLVLGTTAIAVMLNKRGLLQRAGQWIPSFSFDKILSFLFVQPMLLLSEISHKSDTRVLDRSLHGLTYLNFGLALLIAWIDSTIIDGLTRGFAWALKSIGNILRQLVAGKIQDYLWWTLLGAAGLFIYIINSAGKSESNSFFIFFIFTTNF